MGRCSVEDNSNDNIEKEIDVLPLKQFLHNP